MAGNEVRSCCFTGHRPERLPFGDNEMCEKANALKLAIRVEIMNRISEGCMIFITGCARGVDIICGEMALDLKKQNPKMKLVCIVPFREQANRWSANWKARYVCLLRNADETILLSDHYHKGCFHERNRYMVNASTDVIAVYDGKRTGGTANTVRYALETGKQITIIDPLRCL